MFNEIIFFAQVFIIALFSLLVLRLGKSELVSFMCLLTVLSNVLILKQISLFGFAATCCDAYAIGAILSLNLLQEYYGKKTAQKASGVSFILLVFYVIMTSIHLIYIPHELDTGHTYFLSILGVMPRIAAASLFLYF